MKTPDTAITPDVPIPADVTGKFEGPVPPILARNKPANSTMTRVSPSASVSDGPFGGKAPQS